MMQDNEGRMAKLPVALFRWGTLWPSPEGNARFSPPAEDILWFVDGGLKPAAD
jgi:hypothetical protein